MIKRNSWIVVTVAVLVVLNIALLSFVWLRQPVAAAPVAAPGREEGEGPARLIKTELRFDPAQESQFDSLRSEHHRTAQDCLRRLRILKEQYFSGIQRSEPPSDSVAGAIARLQAELDRNTYDHFRRVRAICSPDQQQRFDALLQRILAGLDRPQRPGGPPGLGERE